MRWPDFAVRVRVPATSANLGPGFDALGLALGLYDEVEARVIPGGLSLDVAGEGADEVAGAGEKHLVVRAMRAAFDDLGREQPGLALRCVNRIPHGRGLGSSAAAIVAGVLAARALAGAGTGPAAALPLASELEGHPDNVAPCLYGGLTIAWLAAGAARAIRLETLPDITPVAIIAPVPVSTEAARGLLPAHVPHADAASNAGRSALLVAALTACPEALLEATEDRLHQDYRAPAMPETHDLVRRLRAAGIPAVVSGAGPSVLAFPSRDGDLDTVGSTALETGIAWLVSPLDVERQGASVIPAVPQSVTRGPGVHGSQRVAELDPSFPDLDGRELRWPRRNTLGTPSVKLGAASDAPLRADAVHPHVTWAVTYTCLGSGLSASCQEDTPFPCAVPRFIPSRRGPRRGSRETDIREVPSRLRARVSWYWTTEYWETEYRETGCGNRVPKPSADPTGIDDAGLAGKVTGSGTRAGSGRHLGGRGS